MSEVDYNKINVGDFVRDHRFNAWYLVNYKYANEKMLSCSGLGKGGEFPVLLEELNDHVDCSNITSALANFHGDDHILWIDSQYSCFWVTTPETRLEGDKEIVERNCYRLMSYHKSMLNDNLFRINHQAYVSFNYQMHGMIALKRFPSGTPTEKIKEFASNLDMSVIFLNIRQMERIDFKSECDYDYVSEEAPVYSLLKPFELIA